MIIDHPLRLEIQVRLAEVLKEIDGTNGYVSDLSGNVFRGRLYYGDESPIPMVSILEVPIPLDQIPPPETSTAQSGQWELIIQGFIDDDRENPTDPAHVLMADVKKRLAIERTKSASLTPESGILGLGNAVINLHIGAGVVRPPDDVSSKAYFWLTITLDLCEDMGEPYTA